MSVPYFVSWFSLPEEEWASEWVWLIHDLWFPRLYTGKEGNLPPFTKQSLFLTWGAVISKLKVNVCNAVIEKATVEVTVYKKSVYTCGPLSCILWKQGRSCLMVESDSRPPFDAVQALHRTSVRFRRGKRSPSMCWWNPTLLLAHAEETIIFLFFSIPR